MRHRDHLKFYSLRIGTTSYMEIVVGASPFDIHTRDGFTESVSLRCREYPVYRAPSGGDLLLN